MLQHRHGGLFHIYSLEKILIEPYGQNSLRIRITPNAEFSKDSWALLPLNESDTSACRVDLERREIQNGKIIAQITQDRKLTFYNDQHQLLLAEYEYDRHSSLGLNTRQLKSTGGGLYASMKFASDPNEKLFGMGQYQNGIWNLKGAVLELAQRNSQASVPFVLSSKGYGFLWNNPAVGRASFGTNITEWEAKCTDQIEFWITAGDTPEEILKNYMAATGLPPMMPEHGLGFWQCKLRYQTQDELMQVARRYHRMGIPLDVIIADYYHWTSDGNWKFDPQYWPDPKAMVEELNEMGTKLMVSVWPTVAEKSENYAEMMDRGLLIRAESGVNVSMTFIDPTLFTDVTNPEARDFLWQKIQENYVSLGIHNFWLDVAEPEYAAYDFENYRYHAGNVAKVGNIYPAMYTKAFYDGLTAMGEKPVNLVRCAWAGSQRYGALVWSGDIPSTFQSFRTQIICGLQMAIAGIPWWTTDIGGFHDGNIHDPAFQELLIRWFQYGAFCPVMRLHGDRKPTKAPISQTGGGRCRSGAENEIWSYGEENERIMRQYILLRDALRPYTRSIMQETHETGAPVIRPLFYAYPQDENTWAVSDQFLFGGDILVAPVIQAGQKERMVYLPRGEKWQCVYTDACYDGGQSICCPAPMEKIPLFIRADKPELKAYFAEFQQVMKNWE